MQRYKIVVQYDGTHYLGWQVQKEGKTIAGTLQDTFKKVFNHEIIIIGASRTDAGVHALNQVATFTCALAIEPERMQGAWNNLLPDDIYITTLQPVSNDFDPHAQVVQKTYVYHIFTKRPSPFVARYGYTYYQMLDVKKLDDALQKFVGTHDFRSFCTGDDREHTVRRVDSITVEPITERDVYDLLVERTIQPLAKNGKALDGYRITVKGPGFLRYMIRRMIGAALFVAVHEHTSAETIQQAIEEKNPNQTLPNAPAQGLVLVNILYAKDIT
jgi:tRNA pseudouridine38-40 synthase